MRAKTRATREIKPSTSSAARQIAHTNLEPVGASLNSGDFHPRHSRQRLLGASKIFIATHLGSSHQIMPFMH
jgi:hypothetical protein